MGMGLLTRSKPITAYYSTHITNLRNFLDITKFIL